MSPCEGCDDAHPATHVDYGDLAVILQLDRNLSCSEASTNDDNPCIAWGFTIRRSHLRSARYFLW